MFYQKVLQHFKIFVNDEVPLTSPQTVEQINVIKKIVLLEASRLHDLVINKKQGNEIQFSPEKEKSTHHCCFHPTISGDLKEVLIYHFCNNLSQNFICLKVFIIHCKKNIITEIR